MLLAIDSGNTSINFAIYDKLKCVARLKLSSNNKITSDFLYVMLSSLFAKHQVKISEIDASFLSSVTPSVDVEIHKFVEETFSHSLDQINSGKFINIIPTIIKENTKIGQDRLVNAWYGYHLAKSACIIVDFGTATNFDFVNDEGIYVGGMIAPGLDLSIESLYVRTAQLPKIKFKPFPKFIGDDTISAMQSGIFWGYRSMIQGILSKSSTEFSSKAKIFATGGYAKQLDEKNDLFDTINTNFTLDGMAELYYTKT